MAGARAGRGEHRLARSLREGEPAFHRLLRVAVERTGALAHLAEEELTAAWLLGRVPAAVFAPWVLVRAGRAGRGPGPDVREAVFALPSGVTVAGDVEVHLRALDFARHGHATDPRYAGVVLHLVWEDDGETRGVLRLPDAEGLARGGVTRTVAVAPALHSDAERLRALVRRGPSGHEPCSDGAKRNTPESVRDALAKAGLARLAERSWHAAHLVAERGWERAWELLLERALRGSVGRRFESPAARVELGTRITAGLGDEVMAALRAAACEAQPRVLIAVLRGSAAIGAGRAAEVGWNAALPLLAAYAAAYDDVALARTTAALAAAWPAPRPYGRSLTLAGLLGVKPRRAVEAQGLLHTQDLWCGRGGCGVCPFSMGQRAAQYE